MKLFFITNISFTDRDYDRFGVNFFIDNKVNVEILNLSKFDYKQASLKSYNTTKIKIKFFDTQEEFLSFSDNFIDSLIIDLRPEYLNSLFPLEWFQNLQNKGAKLVKLETNLLPTRLISTTERIYDLLFKFNFKKIQRWYTSLQIFNNRLIKKNKIIYDILIKTGEYQSKIKAKFIINSHCFDYDIYLSDLKSKEKKDIFLNEKIIFIDKMVSNHPDFILYGVKPYTNPESYYPIMNDFFNQIELFFNNKITICLHPKEKNDAVVSKNFINRKVLKNLTYQAIRNCNLVISHDSAALNFAILWNKPLLLVTTNDLEKNNSLAMSALTKSLNIKSFNVNKLDKNINWDYESKKIRKNYQTYKNTYIKTINSQNENSWKIFLDSIKDIYKLENI